MTNILFLWLPISISLAALVGLIVVLVAVIRSRDEQHKLLAVLEQLRSDQVATAEHDQQKEQHRVQQQQLQEQVGALKRQLAAVMQQIELSVNNNTEVKQQLDNLAHSQAALEQQILQQQEAIQEVAEQDPESKFYQRAARLVQQGASLEEIMDACELPRAEAELLYSLYKK